MRSLLAMLALGLGLGLAACQEQAPPSPAPSATPTPTAQQTPTQTAQPTPSPSAKAAAPAKPSSRQYRAIGTEPFWTLDQLPGQLRYSSPDNQQGTLFAVSVAVTGETTRFTGNLEGKPVILLIEPGQCSDGMSDTVYAWKATFTWGDRIERGCARAK